MTAIRQKFNRRQFLKSTAGAALASTTFPAIIPASALGSDGAVAPGSRIAVACIGTGPQGSGLMSGFLRQRNAQVVAICDVKREQREQGRAIVNKHYENQDCKTYVDFREILARPDIDACVIATPDHWHVPIGVAAVRAGKDIYLEKPIGCSVAEGHAMRKAVQETGRIFQFGTQQRSDRKFRMACELARSGMLGKLKTVYVWAPGSAPGGSTKIVPVPSALDYEMWLGPAPFKPYAENRCDADGHTKTWWFDTDYAVGFIAGWGIHPMDIAIWGAGDLMKGMVELEGTGNYPVEGACNTATIWDVRLNFDSGLTVIFAGTPNGGNASRPTGEAWPHLEELKAKFGSITTHGTAFEGTEGWARVHRGDLATGPEELATADPGALAVKLKTSPDHTRNFLDAVTTREPAVSPVEEAVWGDTLCQISDIAARLQRKLRFDFKTERFINDAEANRRLALRAMRPPWRVSLEKKSDPPGWQAISTPRPPSGPHPIAADHRPFLTRRSIQLSLTNTGLHSICWRIQEKTIPQIHPGAFLAAIVESADDAIIGKDLNSTVTSWNPAAERLFAYRAEEIIGKSILTLIPPDRAAEESIVMGRIRRGERVDHFETVRLRKGGSPVHISVTISPVKNEDGGIIGASTIARDITARKLAEHALAARIRQQRVVAELGMAALRHDDVDQLFDRAVADIAATLEVELCKVLELLPGGNALLLRAGVGWKENLVGKEAVSAGGDSQAGFTLLSNEPVIVEDLRTETRFSGPALLHDHGVISGISCVITGHKGRPWGVLGAHARSHRSFNQDDVAFLQAVANVLASFIQRRSAEQQFRLAVEAAPNGMVMVDEQGLIIMVNDQMERLFGYTRAEMLGQPVEILLPERYRGAHPAQRLGFLASPKARAMGHGRDLFARRKDGTEFPVEVGLNPAGTSDGTVVLAAVIDITERKRMEAELARAHAELAGRAQDLEAVVADRTAHLHQIIGELEGISYSLSHDMRAPLRAICSFSQIILAEAGEKLTAEQKDLLTRSINAASRLDRLIQDVLSYSRITREPIRIGPVDVDQLMRQIIEERPELQLARSEIRLESPLHRVRGHEAHLTQCITNLLDNAIKFVEPGRLPNVRIWSEAVDDQVRLWIEDNGIGIPVEFQERIFGIFQRVYDEKSYAGTGIGLAIVRKAVERMGGMVGVESQPGRGSRFWIQLPQAN